MSNDKLVEHLKQAAAALDNGLEHTPINSEAWYAMVRAYNDLLWLIHAETHDDWPIN